MAKIETVDYEKMPSQAREMRSYGQDLNSEMIQIYKRVNVMHDDWYGKRYNALVKQFNQLIPSLEEILQLVVTTFPSTLEMVANNYSQADKGTTVAPVDTTGPKKIAIITVANDVGMRFITAEVENAQNAIMQGFKKSKHLLDQIQSVQQRITWTSEAATSFATKFKKLKTQIFNEFDSLETEFKNLMEQTKADIQHAESSNTVQ